MRYILIFILILNSIASLAQGYGDDDTVSKFKVDRIDDMTGVTEKRTEWNTLKWVTEKFSMRFSLLDSICYLDFEIWSKKIRAFDEGKVLILKLENGSLLNFYNNKFSIPSNEVVRLNFKLDIENLIKLSESRIIKFRIIATEGYDEEEVNKSKGENVQKNALLMFTEGYGHIKK